MDKNYMLMSDKLFHPVARRELILSSFCAIKKCL